MRSRACNQPVPAHGGSNCTKDDSSGSLGEETRNCGERSCTSGELGLKPYNQLYMLKLYPYYRSSFSRFTFTSVACEDILPDCKLKKSQCKLSCKVCTVPGN